jgi:hypothetical protein
MSLIGQQVMVRGSDGKMYSSPQAAQAAGVNYTMGGGFRGVQNAIGRQRGVPSSVSQGTQGGIQQINPFQPSQPPTPPPRQDNLTNFTRMLGGGNFNNPNFRGQPLPQYQGPQVPTAPPRAPQQGGGQITTGREFLRDREARLPMIPSRNFLEQRQRLQPQMPPQGGGQVTNQAFLDRAVPIPNQPPQMRRPLGGGGRNPSQTYQPQVPPQGGGFQPLQNLYNQRQKMPQPPMPSQGGDMVSGPDMNFLLDGRNPSNLFLNPFNQQPQVPTRGQPTPPGLTVLPPRFGDSAPPMQGPRPGGPFVPTGPMDEMTRRRVESGQQFKYGGGSPSTPINTVADNVMGGYLGDIYGSTAPPSQQVATTTAMNGDQTFRDFKQDPYGTMNYGDSFKPLLSGGGLTSGTTNFTRYDPVTDTYHGTIGGIAGNIPITRKGSEVSDAFKTNFEASFAQNDETSPPSGSAGTGTTTTTGTGATTTTGTGTTTTTGTGTTPTTTTDTGTTPTTGTASGEQPFVTSVDKTETRMDPITQQLLFGLDGQGGFIPGAFEAAERTFFDAQGRPIVVPQEIAGLSPDQLRAAQLARSQVGVQRPFIEEAMGLGRQGLGSLERGLTDQAIFDKEALQEMRRGADFALDQRDLGLMDALGGIAEGRGKAIGAEARLRGDLADQERFQTGATDKYLQQLGQREGIARSAADQFGMDLARTRQQGRRTFDEFGRDVTDSLGMRAMAGEGLDRDLARSELMATLGTDRQRRGLGRAEGTLMRGIGGLDTGISEAEGLTRRSTRGFDPSMTEQFFDPFEDRVVQQTIEDISEQATKGDIAQRARDIASGGQSAFGSRAKLAAGERAEALGRGLAKEIGALRSRGFGQAQQSALGEFARQRGAESAAASGLSSLAGQRFGGRQALSGARERRSQQELAASRGLSDILSRGATQRFGAGSGFADAASQAAAQKLGAGTAFGDLIGRTAAQQLGAQQQLGQTLGQTGASGFGALSGLGSLIGSGAQQRFAAGTGLGQTLAGLGQASAGARQQAGSTGMGISSNLANLFRGIGGTQAQGGAQLGSAQAGFGSQLAGLGSQLQQAGTSDIGLLQGMGAQAQAQRQRELDAQRAMLLQAQQAPLAQYQALMPFVGMAPTGQTTFRTQFGTPPSALQAGLGVGLSGLGALGNFYNRDRTKD